VLPTYLAEQIANWAEEFAASDAARELTEEARDLSVSILSTYLWAASERAGGAVEDIEPGHLQSAFLEDLPPLDLPEGVHPQVPGMVRAFLEQLEVSGRLAGGRAQGASIAVAAPAYLKAASGAPEPSRRTSPSRASPKVGRNDPCPCGSGKKYKRCCQGG
jgi:hypothetical protein